MSLPILCGHQMSVVTRHDERLEFGVDRIDGLPWFPRDTYNARVPGGRRKSSRGWPKGWPKPPTWTYTWLR